MCAIAADSVRMERESFAAWARSPDFFDTARHPWIQFRAAQLPERLLFEGGEIEGELSLRGITRTMRFVLRPAECPRPGTDCPVRAVGDVQRSQFGMDARAWAGRQGQLTSRSEPYRLPTASGGEP